MSFWPLYLAYLGIGVGAVGLAQRRSVALAVFFAGWLVLPVGSYPSVSQAADLPFWIIGIAIPSDMLVTKAWVCAVTALMGLLVADPARLRRLAFSPLDALIVLWCLWPLTGAWRSSPTSPNAVIAMLYEAGSWGALWIMGRIWFVDADGQRLLLRACALSGVACLPVALLEAAHPPFLYVLVYGGHPFATDGIIRYVGFRPLGFFEDGNQYGIWTAVAALAAVLLAIDAPSSERSSARLLAVVATGIAVAAQSVGAILLATTIGLLILVADRTVVQRCAVGGTIAFCIGAAVFLSGAVPIEQIAHHSGIGEHVLYAFRAVGRGSLPWRISQDLKALVIVRRHLWFGSGNWDWWRPIGGRPWGFAMLQLGQFGMIGVALAYTPPVIAVTKGLMSQSTSQTNRKLVGTLAAVVAVALIDSLLNAFLYPPMILIAGALANLTSGGSGAVNCDSATSRCEQSTRRSDV